MSQSNTTGATSFFGADTVDRDKRAVWAILMPLTKVPLPFGFLGPIADKLADLIRKAREEGAGIRRLEAVK